MKWLSLWTALTAVMTVTQAGVVVRPELAGIKTVYLLPMTYSLDQFLAVRLAKGAVLQVVTDPKLADAILTDHIGTNLEEKLNALYGEKKDADPDKDKNKSQTQFAAPSGGSARSKGAVFLVDRKSRSVVWSDYVRPKSSQPSDLNHAADKIAGQLEKEKKGK
jgi:hypothetical protein